MLHVFSINNQAVSLDEREQYVLSESEKAVLYQQLSQETATQVVILSTCQRFEVYIEATGAIQTQVKEILRAFFGLTPAVFQHQFVEYSSDAALTHLLQVSTGLLAHVLGETQVLGQVKTAYQEAVTYETVTKSFHTIFQSVFRFSKQMHKQTGINDHPVSLSYSAYQFIASKVTTPQTILVLGAGKMGRLFIDYAVKSEHKLIVLNRDQSKLSHLPEAVIRGALADWSAYIASVDIVVSSLELESPLITYQDLEDKEIKRLLLLDLALPRSIESKTQMLPGIELFDLDQLGEIIDKHHFVRRQKATVIMNQITAEVERLKQTLYQQRFDDKRRTQFLFRDQLLTETMADIDRHLPDLKQKQRTIIKHHVKQAVTEALMSNNSEAVSANAFFNTKERDHDQH
ncbi:glutamyl-tRNA reductase [Halolactibacillus halophilus]|uniref:Glutamyl-tRNA reductase n=1 Tax=Halolactibacillus halophilus TaxID=306540 RepID=A0A1I5L1E8_9BACI|nr:glutamyl-tRNA reductase [Halolactibacillus halophilus]GEM00606.1 glutamyl-tRNA reductase [Halolactibacillus halophilus]SFO91149.1 glutamyl-tRNA reductase [Halolactibacillus halophilus]